MPMTRLTYGEAIRDGFNFILETNPKSLVMGQGLWSPWYVGNSMTDLDTKFGKDRVTIRQFQNWRLLARRSGPGCVTIA